ncbi:VanZ family protein [Ruania albidiflava]|uniref:VanZ family protein n=1 Tax=Ruania albidiflava TaxID=366586 RepID=UPI0003B6774D|nr:VanZ family protein [Ruania albidiflava]
MSGPVLPAVIAIVTGVAVGLGLFVPFVALSYRRRGRLSAGRLLLWAAALVYFWALWAYTLLPLPSRTEVQCAGTNLDVLELVGTLREAAGGPGSLLTDPAVLQLALNVVLFLPLGFFVRVLGGRGIVVALLTGLGTSLLIELTQLTGVWGVYSCAYRVFDVDDLLTNTLGAIIGSGLALIVPRRHRGMARVVGADQPRPVTRSRRGLAMVCDWLGFTVTVAGVAVLVQILLSVTGNEALMGEGRVASLVGAGLALVVWAVVVLATGQTIGDLAVELRYQSGPLPQPVARVLRLLGGIGGYGVLTAIPGAAWLGSLFAVVSVLLMLLTTAGRGLPGLVSGQHLVDTRQPRHEDHAGRS